MPKILAGSTRPDNKAPPKSQPWQRLKKLKMADKDWSNHCTKTVVTPNIRILNEFDSTGG
jgi:hypothetical protein